MNIKIQSLHPNFKMPTKATPGSAGFDLYLCGELTIQKNETVKVPLGFCIEIPKGFEAQIRGRSSLTYRGTIVPVGTIDSDYRGEISVVICNLNNDSLLFKGGERIAQMIIQQLPTMDLEIATGLQETTRGAGGFGSTGK